MASVWGVYQYYRPWIKRHWVPPYSFFLCCSWVTGSGRNIPADIFMSAALHSGWVAIVNAHILSTKRPNSLTHSRHSADNQPVAKDIQQNGCEKSHTPLLYRYSASASQLFNGQVTSPKITLRHQDKRRKHATLPSIRSCSVKGCAARHGLNKRKLVSEPQVKKSVETYCVGADVDNEPRFSLWYLHIG